MFKRRSWLHCLLSSISLPTSADCGPELLLFKQVEESPSLTFARTGSLASSAERSADNLASPRAIPSSGNGGGSIPEDDEEEAASKMPFGSPAAQGPGSSWDPPNSAQTAGASYDMLTSLLGMSSIRPRSFWERAYPGGTDAFYQSFNYEVDRLMELPSGAVALFSRLQKRMDRGRSERLFTPADGLERSSGSMVQGLRQLLQKEDKLAQVGPSIMQNYQILVRESIPVALNDHLLVAGCHGIPCRHTGTFAPRRSTGAGAAAGGDAEAHLGGVCSSGRPRARGGRFVAGPGGGGTGVLPRRAARRPAAVAAEVGPLSPSKTLDNP